jgi:hypothetical protein
VLYHAEHGDLGTTVTKAQARVVAIGNDMGVRRRRPTVDHGRPWLSGDLGEGRLKPLEQPLRDLLQAFAPGARLGGDPPRPDLEVRLRLGLRHPEMNVAARRAVNGPPRRQDPSELEHERTHQRVEDDPFQLGVRAGVGL